jgi:hypothetical protein
VFRYYHPVRAFGLRVRTSAIADDFARDLRFFAGVYLASVAFLLAFVG